MRTVVVTLALALARTATAVPSAEQLYDQGQRAFDARDYATAIQRWESSYELSKQPLLVLNVAQAYRLSGDCVNALAAYRRFLVLDPTSDQRELAEGFVAELTPTCREPRAVASRTKSKRSGAGLRLTGVVTGGAGIAMLVAGIVLDHHGQALGNEITAACRTSCAWGALRTEDAAGRRDVAAGNALDAVGAVVIAGGVVLYYLGVRERGIAVSLAPREGRAVVSWSGSW